jgi:hypothetical protein
VWGADDLFFQITVVPTRIVSLAGVKSKLPLLLFVISTTYMLPEAGVGVG